MEIMSLEHMRQLVGHRLRAPGIGGAHVSRMDMTSGDHEFGARFVKKLQMRGERAIRTVNDMRHGP